MLYDTGLYRHRIRAQSYEIAVCIEVDDRCYHYNGDNFDPFTQAIHDAIMNNLGLLGTVQNTWQGRYEVLSRHSESCIQSIVTSIIEEIEEARIRIYYS